jgi:hypothetical protein
MTNQKKLQELQEEEMAKKEKLELKRATARNNFNHTMKELNNRSQTGFHLNMKAVKELTHKRLERDRQHSAKHYESLRHKLEEEETMRKKSS